MKTIMLFLLSLNLMGCATLIHGTTQDIPITTKPSGAIAKTDSGLECTTPCKLTLSRKQDHVILINKEGYEEHSVTCQHVISGAVAGNILAGGLIGWGVDAASGGQYRIVPEHINVTLQPLETNTGLVLEELKKIQLMKESGYISDEEYKKLKSQKLQEYNLKEKDAEEQEINK